LKEPHLSQWVSLTFLLTFHTFAWVIFHVESRVCFIKMSPKVSSQGDIIKYECSFKENILKIKIYMLTLFLKKNLMTQDFMYLKKKIHENVIFK
jgi:hypothetical protein